MSVSVAEPSIAEPLKRFVRDSRARLALLLHPSGQVLGQYGFQDAVEVMSAAALASAIFASAGALGQVVEGRGFTELHHGQGDRQIYISEVRSVEGLLVLLVVFGRESSLGLVRLYGRELCAAVQAAPPAAPPPEPLDANFEDELRRSLSLLFGGHVTPVANTPA